MAARVNNDSRISPKISKTYTRHLLYSNSKRSATAPGTIMINDFPIRHRRVRPLEATAVAF
jgi:hypothetical protein